MSKLPGWMQACLHLCTITGVVVWIEIILKFLRQYA